MDMAVKKQTTKNHRSICHGRPPLARTQTTGFSSKATRTLIQAHHNLQKAYAQALKNGNDSSARDLEVEIAARGGLATYQLASTRGQSAERGGDSSRVLVEWLQTLIEEARGKGQRFRVLEIGALSTRNACSRVSCLDVRRIDLRSHEPGIEEMDFMDMAVPEGGKKFHIISLSLVLNYVPDPAARGLMLARLPKFLEIPTNERLIPSVFLVLPLACITNSRYLTGKKLSHIMRALGFRLAKEKTSLKLYYSLWIYEPVTSSSVHFYSRKEVLRSGSARNNFAITLGSRDQN